MSIFQKSHHFWTPCTFPHSPIHHDWDQVFGILCRTKEDSMELQNFLQNCRIFYQFILNVNIKPLAHIHIHSLTNLWACHYQTQGQIFIYTRGLQGIIRFLMWISSVSELVLDSFARSKTRKVVKFFIFIDGFLIKQHLQT